MGINKDLFRDNKEYLGRERVKGRTKDIVAGVYRPGIHRAVGL
jgi:hypothetical protein